MHAFVFLSVVSVASSLLCVVASYFFVCFLLIYLSVCLSFADFNINGPSSNLTCKNYQDEVGLCHLRSCKNYQKVVI